MIKDWFIINIMTEKLHVAQNLLCLGVSKIRMVLPVRQAVSSAIHHQRFNNQLRIDSVNQGHFADDGVVLMLFTVTLQFSLREHVIFVVVCPLVFPAFTVTELL